MICASRHRRSLADGPLQLTLGRYGASATTFCEAACGRMQSEPTSAACRGIQDGLPQASTLTEMPIPECP